MLRELPKKWKKKDKKKKKKAIPPGEGEKSRIGARSLWQPWLTESSERVGPPTWLPEQTPQPPSPPSPPGEHPSLLFSCSQLRTDSEKRSLAESGLSWFSESEEKAPKKLEYDSGSLKMEPGASKWRRERPESCDDASKIGELKKPVSLGHPGSLKKGKTPPVAVTSPITHTAQSALKVAGEPAVKEGWGRILLLWPVSRPFAAGGEQTPACCFLPSSPPPQPELSEEGGATVSISVVQTCEHELHVLERLSHHLVGGRALSSETGLTPLPRFPVRFLSSPRTWFGGFFFQEFVCSVRVVLLPELGPWWPSLASASL